MVVTFLFLFHSILPSFLPSFPRAACLGADEEYVVVPTTFGDGKLGSFIVSVTSTSDFSFIVEKK